jgi:hypothetical protein
MTESPEQTLPPDGGDQDAEPPDPGIPGPVHPEEPAEGPERDTGV